MGREVRSWWKGQPSEKNKDEALLLPGEVVTPLIPAPEGQGQVDLSVWGQSTWGYRLAQLSQWIEIILGWEE